MNEDAKYFTEIGAFLVFHSKYKGYMIYRQWNPLQDRGMMSYFGIKWPTEEVSSATKPTVSIHAKNLDGIKAAISKVKV